MNDEHVRIESTTICNRFLFALFYLLYCMYVCIYIYKVKLFDVTDGTKNIPSSSLLVFALLF